MEITHIGHILKKKQFGPFVHILLYLDEKDRKKLAFVISSSYKEMKSVIEEFESKRILAAKIETKIFDPRSLSFCHLIPEIIKFVDQKKEPLNQFTDEEKEHVKKLQIRTEIRFPPMDYETFGFAIERGEKFSKEVIGAILIKEHYNFNIIQKLMNTYKDRTLVLSMIHEKSLFFYFAWNTDIHRAKDIYELFGMEYLMNMISSFNIRVMMEKLLHSMRIYIEHIENLGKMANENEGVPCRDDILRYMDVSGKFDRILQEICNRYLSNEQREELLIDHYLEHLMDIMTDLTYFLATDEELYCMLEKKYE